MIHRTQVVALALTTLVISLLGETFSAFGADLPARLEASEIESSFHARVGLMQYSIASVIAIDDSNLQNLTLEYEHFVKANRSFTLAYRLAMSEFQGRLLYQSAMFGHRYYYMTPGYNKINLSNTHMISLKPNWMPYFEGGLSLGNFLVQPLGERGATTIASETVGVFLGSGVHYSVSPQISVDLSLQFEQIESISNLALTGTNIYFLIGSGFFF